MKRLLRFLFGDIVEIDRFVGSFSSIAHVDDIPRECTVYEWERLKVLSKVKIKISSSKRFMVDVDMSSYIEDEDSVNFSSYGTEIADLFSMVTGVNFTDPFL